MLVQQPREQLRRNGRLTREDVVGLGLRVCYLRKDVVWLWRRFATVNAAVATAARFGAGC